MINDILIQIYPWVKALHVISVISWMAALLYLPRLFVHHTERGGSSNSEISEIFKMMEGKLLKVIMNPAMVATWLFGLLMIATPGVIDFSADIWFHVKFLSVILMTGFHMWLAKRYKEFCSGQNTRTGRTYRLMNEIPTILMIIIVIMVIVRPF